MCPSMADTDFYTKKPQKISSEVPANHASPSKYFHEFLYKAIIVTIFLVILPLLPSQAPEFINQNLHARSWELLQLIFVGIAVSYGLFSKRNDETDKEHYSKFDNAQSYVSRLLQVSSVFDDETENPSASDDNKVQTWNSQYYRGEPVVMVAKENSILEKQNAAITRTDEKPLLLPVRSLKSRVSETNETETTPESSGKTGSVGRSNSNLGSKRFSTNSRKSRNGELGRASQAKMEENIEENVVHRSPIPWRSRSGRLEMKEDEDGLSSYSQPPKMDDSEPNRFESRSFRFQSFLSSRPKSACPSPNKPSPPPTPSSPKIQSPLPYLSPESQAKSVEDVVRKKNYYKSPPPPPPPPPPPFLQKSLMKSKSSLSSEGNYPQKEMRRSIWSVPNDLSETESEGLSRKAYSGDIPLLRKSVRTIRQSEPVMKSVKTREFDEDVVESRRFTDKMMHTNSPNFKRKSFTEFPEEEKKEVIEQVLLETDDEDSVMTESEDDYFEEGLGSSGTEEPANDNTATDEGPDVDKKADEFIAKFREQIRLQRIESIRTSAGQLARNRPR